MDINTLANTETATLAGGCFWCIESAFKDMPGIIKITSGYAGGNTIDPTYIQVCSGKTGHVEAVQILFNPEIVEFSKLLDRYWLQIDPTDPGGQFADRGSQYQTVIFYHSIQQLKTAQNSLKQLSKSGKYNNPIATRIEPFSNFFPAEAYHQDYANKNPLSYMSYVRNSGRKKSS